MIGNREVHPAAEIFPLMQGRAFSELVADITEHGLREPIVLLEGAILDGRNRARACEAAGRTLRFTEYQGERDTKSILDYVKIISVQELTPAGLRRLAPSITRLARAEGLEAHARSVEVRLHD